jgi:hypothetical protein
MPCWEEEDEEQDGGEKEKENTKRKEWRGGKAHGDARERSKVQEGYQKVLQSIQKKLRVLLSSSRSS